MRPRVRTIVGGAVLSRGAWLAPSQRIQPVTHSVDILDDVVRHAGGAYLVPDIRDMRLHRVVVAEAVVARDFFAEHVSAEDLPRVAHQRFEDRVLRGRQRYVPFAVGNGSYARIQPQIAVL